MRFEACINEIFHFFLHNQSQITEAVKMQLCRRNIYFIMLLSNIVSNKDSPGHRLKVKQSTPLNALTVAGASPFWGDLT